MSYEWQFPEPDEHVSIIGRNGTGKSQAGAWLLSHSDLTERPHFILDWKREELFNSITKAQRLELGKKLPEQPGLYLAHFMPDDPYVDDTLWQIYNMENACVFTDEGYMVDRFSQPYRALLTQGRSKNINVYTLTQRPTGCAREVFSEASFFCVFPLNDDRDKKIIEGFAKVDFDKVLPQYNSHWCDVKKDVIIRLQPVPDAATILSRFDTVLPEPTPKGSFF